MLSVRSAAVLGYRCARRREGGEHRGRDVVGCAVGGEAAGADLFCRAVHDRVQDVDQPRDRQVRAEGACGAATGDQRLDPGGGPGVQLADASRGQLPLRGGKERPSLVHQMPPDPETVNALVSSLSLQRMGYPDEIAAAIAFLASPAASYVTGAVLDAHGGYNA